MNNGEMAYDGNENGAWGCAMNEEWWNRYERVEREKMVGWVYGFRGRNGYEMDDVIMGWLWRIVKIYGMRTCGGKLKRICHIHVSADIWLEVGADDCHYAPFLPLAPCMEPFHPHASYASCSRPILESFISSRIERTFPKASSDKGPPTEKDSSHALYSFCITDMVRTTNLGIFQGMKNLLISYPNQIISQASLGHRRAFNKT